MTHRPDAHRAEPPSDRREPLPGPVVFIDGECVLCDRTASFLVERDRHSVLYLARLQGPLAEQWLGPTERDVGLGGAVVLIEPDRGNRVSSRSRAILRALARLGGAWKLLALLASTPGLSSLLDVVYRWVARHRYRWFGRDVCLVPDPTVRARLLDDVETERRASAQS